MTTIHAHTEPRGPLPAYINVSQRPVNPDDAIVTVRSTGENNSSVIILSRAELMKLSDDIAKHLGVDYKTSTDTPGPETITFAEFVQYGRVNGGNIVGGMPWSFNFHGHPVTHENDQCYLIGVNDGQARFTNDQVLVLNPDGSLVTMLAETPRV